MDKTKERKFLNSPTIVALSAFVALNAVALGYLPKTQLKFTEKIVRESANEQRQKGNWAWWLTRNYIVKGTKSDVVFMGSSQMGSALYASEAEYLNEAVDTVTHRESNLASNLFDKKVGARASAFNLALGGAMASDQYMMARALFNSEHKPKLVVIGVNPRDFIDNSMPSASCTDTFRYLSPYVNLGAALGSCAFPDPIAWMDWQINETLPAKIVGEQLRAWIPESILKVLPTKAEHIVKADGSVALETTATASNSSPSSDSAADGKTASTGSAKGDVLQAIYGNQDDVSPGQWRVVACSWGAFKDNTPEYQMRYKNSNPAIFPGQKKFFEAYLSYLKEQDIKVLIVGMPSLWPNRALLPDKFWGDFRQYLSSTSTGYGASFVDLTADPRFDSKDYLDTVHLNSTGGRRLLDIVTDKIAQNEKLASALTESSIAKTDADSWH